MTEEIRWLCKQCGLTLEDQDDMVIHIAKVHRHGIAMLVHWTEQTVGLRVRSETDYERF